MAAAAAPVMKWRRTAILGYRGVGKSSLAQQFIIQEFPKVYVPTISQNWNTNITVDGEEFELNVVDTAGVNQYTLLPSIHFVNIHGFIVVYSVSCIQSFIIARLLHTELIERIGIGPTPVLLVGNKSDVPEESRKVPTAKGQKLADRWGAAFTEVTATDPEQSKEIFVRMIQEINRVDKAQCQGTRSRPSTRKASASKASTSKASTYRASAASSSGSTESFISCCLFM